MQEYGEYQKMMNPGFDNPESQYYLGFIYSYPMDGEDILPRGDKGRFDYTPSGGAIWHVLPTSIKDTVEFAYLHEDIEFTFAKAPTPDIYPPEVNIPKD